MPTKLASSLGSPTVTCVPFLLSLCPEALQHQQHGQSAHAERLRQRHGRLRLRHRPAEGAEAAQRLPPQSQGPGGPDAALGPGVQSAACSAGRLEGEGGGGGGGGDGGRGGGGGAGGGSFVDFAAVDVEEWM